MIEFLSPNDLCYSIVSTKLHDNSQFTNLDKSLKKLHPSGSFPILNFINMKQYQKDHKNGVDFLVSLNKYSFSFPINTECLNLLRSNPNYLQTSPDYVVIIILHMYISWYMNFIRNHSTTDIDILLQSLLYILPIKNCKNIGKSRIYAASAFMHIFSDIVESTYLKDATVLFSPMVEFLTMNNDIPQFSFDIILKLSNRIIDKNSSNFSKETSQFVNFVVMIIRTCGKRCPQYITTAIVFLMRNSLIGLDEDALSFLGRSLQTLGVDVAFDIVSEFPNSIVNFIQNHPPIFPCDVLSCDSGITFPPGDSIIENKLITFHTLDSENLIFSKPPYFPELLPPTDFIHPGLLKKFELISKIIENEKSLLDIILKKISELISVNKLSPHFYDICASLLYLMYILAHGSPSPKFPIELFLSPLFDQSLTVFSSTIIYDAKQNENFQKINTIRHLAFINLLYQQPSVIENVFNQIRMRPFAFSELIYRFLPDILNLQQILNASSSIIHGITSAIVFYLQFQNFSDDLREAANEARLAAFTYIDIVLKIPDLRKSFFETSFFIDAIISFIFESPVRKWALSCIVEAFKINLNSMEYLISKCNELYRITFNFSYSECEVHQAETLILFLNNEIFEDAKLAKGFEPVISFIIKWIAGLSQENRSFDILLETLDIFVRFSHVHTLSQSDISAIEKTVNNLYGVNPNNDIFHKIINIISGDFLEYQEPAFSIKQPKGMKLIVSLYENSEFFLEKLKYAVNLCQFKSKNCEQCQKGEFDLFLVGRLSIWRNDTLIKKEVFETALLILRLISSHSSSVLLVQQYISLFCPINSKTLPRFYPEIFDSLQKTILDAKKVPATPLPILSSTRIKVSSIYIPKTFTISFWYFMHANDEQITLIHILNESNKFIVVMNNQKLSVFLQENSNQWGDDINYDISTNQWSFCTISVEMLNDQAFVKSSINGNDIPAIVFPSFDFSNQPSQVMIGITDSDKPHVFLGSFGIFNYFDNSEIYALFDVGPRKIPSNPIFFFTACDKNDYFSLDVSPSNIVTKMSKVRTLHKPSFTNILIDVCGISMLLPTISHIELTFLDDSHFQYLLETFISLLENTLILSQNAQRFFGVEKGFLIISNFLNTLPNISLSYKLFLQFCSLFELLVDEKCRTQLLFGILMKIDIWLRSDAENFKKILRYWSRSLVPQYLDIITRKIGFNDIISQLRIFLWYTPKEKDTILFVNRCKGQTFDVKYCRDLLLSIALMIAKQGLSNDEFKFLISQILTIEEEDQVLDLLNFVLNLIEVHEEVIQKCSDVMESSIFLIFLYSTNLEILELTFNIVIKLYNLHLVPNSTLSQHFDYIMYKLPSSYASIPVLSKLMDICEKSTPQLFSLCSMIAFSLGQDSFIELMNTVKPSMRFCSNPFWPLWSVIAIYKIEDENFQNQVFNYLIEVSPQQWKNIFWILDIVGRAFQAYHNLFKQRFIQEIGAKLLKLQEFDDQKLRHFFGLLPLYLFLRQKKQFDKRLHATNNLRPVRRPPKPNRSSSIVKRPPNRLQSSQPNIRLFKRRSASSSTDNLLNAFNSKSFFDLDFISFKMDELITLVENLFDDNSGFFFGLRITEENFWEDIEIARMANDIFMMFPDKSYYDSILFINAYLLHYDPQKVMKTNSVINVQNIRKSGPYFLYNKHADRLGYEKLYDCEKIDLVSNSFLFLQDFESKYHDDRMLHEISQYLQKNSLKSNDLYSILEFEISQASSEFISNEKEILNLNNTKFYKCWNHLWRSLTIDRAPWCQTYCQTNTPCKTIDKPVHFRRDFTMCIGFVPSKLKQNHRFNDHSQASFIRDHNSYVSTSLLKEKRKNQLFEEYKNSETSSYLLIDDNDIETDESSQESILQIDPKCLFEAKCQLITVNRTIEALFSLQKDCIVILKKDQTAKIIKIENISQILMRTHLQRETAIEIFLDDGSTFFLNFPFFKSYTIISQFKMLKQKSKNILLQLHSPKQFMQSFKFTSQWINQEISNFDYLMILNKISGRSFNNAFQYPIFPWILIDYESTKIDINDPTIYRDLSKPIGALKKECQKIFIDSYKHNSYFYANGYISSIHLYRWLVRMEPFTSLHIEFQDGQFSPSSQQFRSIPQLFKTIKMTNNEVHELIPEFFFQPEFLMNYNHFDLGLFNEKSINDVVLPNWAASAFDFIYLHRKALESDFVSLHLHEWIDLIWGDKQRGQKAIDSMNVFMPEMYPDVWDTPKGQKFENRPDIEAVLEYIGQIPQQIFDKPHPIRSLKPNLENSLKSNNKDEKTVLNYHIDCEAKIIMAKIIQQSEEKSILTFLTIDKHGICQETTLNFTSYKEKMNKKKLNQQNKISKEKLNKEQPRIRKLSEISHTKSSQCKEKLNKRKWEYVYLNNTHKFLSVDKHQKSDIFLVDIQTGNTKRVIKQRNDIITMTTDNNLLVIANKDSKIAIYSLKDFKVIFSLPSFRDWIKCCFISHSFHSLICGTRDQSLMICSMTNHSLIRIVELNAKPIHCITTQSWGFHVIYSKKIVDGQFLHSLSLYNINGYFIKEKEISVGIAAMIPLKDCKGFDFILAVDVANQIYLFEAFYCDIGKPIYKTKKSIISMHYMHNEQVIVLLCKDGDVYFVPATFNYTVI
ncbi:hypothetical protein TRFO_28088 [Tritrichomonas foetus]|uniref:Beige/BEACH domain containing protein n=1 Tax=Tritrichomonas foetus TaxID=1144522 RepID=A0A1J4JZH9_9EUKA|nr:hypothetical protein TRFO_28088 [Tritrichomonas foetus]|eukprot:OHT04387.1 hypothetical protein TRFO_28088 [Tritrichomonas foetus]